MEQYDFRLVSPTALVPAFARGGTTIPFATEMMQVLRERGAVLSESGPFSEETARTHAPFFEARFRAVSHVVEEKGATQVLELAAGLSPRGMELTQRGLVYVEADLADSIAMKHEIVTAILGHVPEGLHLCTASVIDRLQMLECCSHFVAGRPVAVTTEGLLRYLTFEEKAQLAANVLEVLQRYDGWWVTPDIHLKSVFARQSAEQKQREREQLGRSLGANYFEDLDHARRFFERSGFRVEARPLPEGIEGWLFVLTVN
jgi:O-methyltransferase involved in polyketide biosynthesis